MSAQPRPLRTLLLDGPVGGVRAIAALIFRVGAGAVFVVFGVGKFTNHASEVASFQDYGLPAPDAFVYVIGVLEIVGGVLLILGLATRVAALLLAGDMVGAIVVSGIARGETVSSHWRRPNSRRACSSCGRGPGSGRWTTGSSIARLDRATIPSRAREQRCSRMLARGIWATIASSRVVGVAVKPPDRGVPQSRVQCVRTYGRLKPSRAKYS